MSQKPLFKLFGIVALGLLLALIFLPAFAGLIEGNFDYVRWEFDHKWLNGRSLLECLSNVYAWSFWRIGLREQPNSYLIYEIIQSIRTGE